MKQRPIDLLPEGIRARGQAGVVAGRYVAALLIGVVLVGLMGTHSHLVRDLARQRLRAAQKEADIALSAEARAEQLRLNLEDTRQFIDRYDVIALPLDLSRVVATLVNILPQSATLERITLDGGVSRGNVSARARAAGESEGPRPRVLNGELTGFALSDQDVAQIVTELERLGLFEHVSLDYSRTRAVRGRNAREFRISFRADLDVRYEVSELPQSAAGHSETPDVK